MEGMKLPVKIRALPMPLWLQGVFELGQAAVISALLVVLPVAAVWLTGGFADRSPESAARLAGQGWLVMHGVPLVLQFPAGVAGDGAVGAGRHGVPGRPAWSLLLQRVRATQTELLQFASVLLRTLDQLLQRGPGKPGVVDD